MSEAQPKGPDDKCDDVGDPSEDANPSDPNDDTPREEDGQGEGSPGTDEPS